MSSLSYSGIGLTTRREILETSREALLLAHRPSVLFLPTRVCWFSGFQSAHLTSGQEPQEKGKETSWVALPTSSSRLLASKRETLILSLPNPGNSRRSKAH